MRSYAIQNDSRIKQLGFVPILPISQADGCPNGDIAIKWEWSNFDPSHNTNPLTD